MLIEGFINGEPKWKEIRAKGIVEMAKLYKEGKLTPAKEVVIEGLEKAPEALINLYKNVYHGKVIIKNVF